ncbi:MAG: hypothetical protein JJU41_08000 [Bacteroidetes bacterium]|nr:hypothetical protein [Bacteroidota bacterium]MCH8523315.1 hypothetical protein [Balneolales bacterium]
MRTILYIIFFYLFYRILRRLIMGPRPKRTFYVNFGKTGPWQSSQGQSHSYTRRDNNASGNGEPMVGGRPQENSSVQKKRVQDIQDAEFKEIE